VVLRGFVWRIRALLQYRLGKIEDGGRNISLPMPEKLASMSNLPKIPAINAGDFCPTHKFLYFRSRAKSHQIKRVLPLMGKILRAHRAPKKGRRPGGWIFYFLFTIPSI